MARKLLEENIRQLPFLEWIRSCKNAFEALEALQAEPIDLIFLDIQMPGMERFTKAALRAWEIQEKRSSAGTPAVLPDAAKAADFFFVNVEYALVKIPIPDITYIEGMKDYVKIFLATAKKPVLTKSALKAMEEKLPAQQFMRVHKSFIVHVAKIESIRNREIRIGEAEIPVGEANLEELLRRLGYAK